MGRYDHSMELLEKAQMLTPGGSQTRSKQASRFPEGAFPAFVERGSGCRVWDVDGHEYVDWVCGLAAVTLGYAYPAVTEAIERQLRDGFLFSLPHRLEAEVAELLRQAVPMAERVRFVKTGSEATEAAIRVARAATGRDVVVTVGAGYHSWHSWFSAVKPEHPGVPEVMEWLTLPFRYNDLASLDAAFEEARLGAYRHGQWETTTSGVAAVILEPTLLAPPAPGFLEGVRDLAHRRGALLIFDEIVTGFRWALGGGQEYFGVRPDLACFGKGMANGMPLACLVGPADLMRHAELVSGTFGGECLSLAAAQATIRTYLEEPVVARLWKSGTAFRDGLAALLMKYSLPARMDGYGVHPVLRWDHPQANILMSLFLQETAARGVLLHPAGWNVSYAHGEAEVRESLSACSDAFTVVKGALESGEPARFLRGAPCQDAKIRGPHP